MADIADIRRHRLERLASNITRQVEESSTKESGGIMGQDSTIPSEFECILCLRYVLLHRCGKRRARGAFCSPEKGCPIGLLGPLCAFVYSPTSTTCCSRANKCLFQRAGLTFFSSHNTSRVGPPHVRLIGIVHTRHLGESMRLP